MEEFGQLIFLALTFPVKVEWLRDWEKSSDHQPFHFLSDKRYVELQYVWKQWMQASQGLTINHSVSATPVVCAKLDQRDCYQTSWRLKWNNFSLKICSFGGKVFLLLAQMDSGSFLPITILQQGGLLTLAEYLNP